MGRTGLLGDRALDRNLSGWQSGQLYLQDRRAGARLKLSAA